MQEHLIDERSVVAAQMLRNAESYHEWLCHVRDLRPTLLTLPGALALVVGEEAARRRLPLGGDDRHISERLVEILADLDLVITAAPGK